MNIKKMSTELELQYYKDKNTPMPVRKDDYYRCGKCNHILCKDDDCRNLIEAEGLINFCPVCGQRTLWRGEEWNTSNFTD